METIKTIGSGIAILFMLYILAIIFTLFAVSTGDVNPGDASEWSNHIRWLFSFIN